MPATDRRRNQYADHCYVCRSTVEAGAGWLYSDVKSQRSRNRRAGGGRWIKQVKCDRCHSEKLTHKWQADNLDNPKPVTPRIGVNEVRKGSLVAGEVPDDRWRGLTHRVVFWRLPDGREAVVACNQPITGEPIAYLANYYNDRLWFGCELTPGSTKFLDEVAERAVEEFRDYLEYKDA